MHYPVSTSGFNGFAQVAVHCCWTQFKVGHTALLVKIIQKPVSVLFSFSSASNCSFITRGRETQGGR